MRENLIKLLKRLLLDRDNFPRMRTERVELTVSQIKELIWELEKRK